ncbi:MULTISPECIES: hypothetical protein [Akkermansia]|jgi:predicted AAA+ superfamily ATPase|uniref:Uncharacterized protein n=1 Tax=Akkermansia massiliensis TaxID=2927224 RepID=A0ABT0R6F1_9BACT|nr:MULTISPECIES: hypothetical protein [Akkermansia]MBT8773752.1 hypothetical protein [Akkermansia muciniphila]MBP9525796.1 hypothetical protein [Akkermansia sp.]MBT8774758.1 hypothetical protein [Akkermansia muciniphila]MBT8779345.1 hypothetical protein [Akkermansia muciniphila]MBT8785660.1 hypothetical protein [Akkermansia muciniphila]
MKPLSTLTGTTRIFRVQNAAIEEDRNEKTGKLRKKKPEFPRAGKFFRKRRHSEEMRLGHAPKSAHLHGQ